MSLRNILKNCYAARSAMSETVAFSTFDDFLGRTPTVCSLCNAQAASFEYDVTSDDLYFESLQGYCCSNCTITLLTALRSTRTAIN